MYAYVYVSPSLSFSQDYPLFIACPMDLTTIKNKLYNRDYEVPKDFINDIKQIFLNAKTYNQQRSQVNVYRKKCVCI